MANNAIIVVLNIKYKTMKKIMFNNKYGLTQAVKEGIKTMTRRVLLLSESDEEYLDQAFDWDLRESVILDRYAEYEVGEIVAVAESYKDIGLTFAPYQDITFKKKHVAQWGNARSMKGWNNKMYVRADLMPSNICITDRKIERLHSIPAEDCLKEGVMIDPYTGFYFVPNLYLHRRTKNTAGPTLFVYPEAAYYSLCKKLRMVLEDAANPWVLAYTFELLKGGNQ